MQGTDDLISVLRFGARHFRDAEPESSRCIRLPSHRIVGFTSVSWDYVNGIM